MVVVPVPVPLFRSTRSVIPDGGFAVVLSVMPATKTSMSRGVVVLILLAVRVLPWALLYRLENPSSGVVVLTLA